MATGSDEKVNNMAGEEEQVVFGDEDIGDDEELAISDIHETEKPDPEEKDNEIRKRIHYLKGVKTSEKSKFTLARRDYLAKVLRNECIDDVELKLIETFQNIHHTLGEICQIVLNLSVKEERLRLYDKFETELDILTMEFEEGLKSSVRMKTDRVKSTAAASYTTVEDKKSDSDSACGKDPQDKEMWSHLKRVSIPTFDGTVRKYQAWYSIFKTCIDDSPASPEYKLLRLREALEPKSEPLRLIETLGHSARAYEAAKVKLERKYGGTRRKIAVLLEELEDFQLVREGNAADFEKLSDLLDNVVVNLLDEGRLHELDNGSLYVKTLKKLPKAKIADFQRWLKENNRRESLVVLKDWLIKEAEYNVIAAETIQGFKKGNLDADCDDKDPNRNRDKNYRGDSRNGRDRNYRGDSRDNYRGDSRDKYRGDVRDKNRGDRNKPNKDSDRNFYGKGYSPRTCKHCDGNHGIWSCEEFKKLPINERWNTAKVSNLCFRCLGDDHPAAECPRSRPCNVNGCTRTHNRLLHTDPGSKKAYYTEDIETKSLRTIPVIIKYGQHRLCVNAMLDDDSTASYLNSDIAAELGLKLGKPENLAVHVLNGQKINCQSQPVDFEIESMNGQLSLKVSAYTTDRVTGNMKAVDWAKYSKNWDHLRELDLPPISNRSIVDLLIGLDCQDVHYSLKDIKGNPGEPIARLTPLGWSVIGNPTKETAYTHFLRTYFVNPSSRLVSSHNTMDCIDLMMQKFWENDSFGTEKCQKSMSLNDKIALEKVNSSMQISDNRYEVGLPWKSNTPPELPDSYNMAVKRLSSVERQLEKKPEVKEMYSANIQDYLQKGYIRKVPVEEQGDTKWYLPHFPVVKMDRSTTKTRIVFDASAKVEEKCLNDFIYQGPKLQGDLFEILLRFRRYPIALVCDVSEMYLQIEMKPEDRLYHRFLWRDCDKSIAKPDVFEFNRVVFGVNSSPFVAQFVSQNNAERNRDKFPRASQTVKQSTYMDDGMDSVMNVSEGIELYNELTELWSLCGMSVKKWNSNSAELLSHIPLASRIKEFDFSGPLPSVKTLGVLWITDEDNFSFKSKSIDSEFKITKRNFLSKIASIFDPLGFLNPFIVRAKILLQEIWTTGADWDEPLDDSLKAKIEKWFSELADLSQIKVPRCLQEIETENLRSISLHTFVDGSPLAYGAVTYFRCEFEDHVTVKFVASKNRVAPLKATSVPRLELMSSIIGLRLSLKIASIFDIVDIVYWTDSMDVIYWLRNPSRTFKPFVANRVGEIHGESKPGQWRHLPGILNSADHQTRGLSVPELAEKNDWWSGPSFLLQPETGWPVTTFPSSRTGNHLEIRKSARTFLCFIEKPEEHPKLNPENYSCWVRLTRKYALVVRFVNNCRLPKQKRIVGSLTPEELSDVEDMIIRTAQRTEFSAEYSALSCGKSLPRNSKLLHLRPRIDEDGLLRCDGRLQNADYLPYDVRYPIILPRKSWVTKLIVKHQHEKLSHVGGTNGTLAELSSRFWIISAREVIREWEKECAECGKRNAKAAQQVMAPLPAIRTRFSFRAFAIISLDFAGPFITIQGRGKKRAKRYLCLFTCLQCRAVHLEMAYSMDTCSFLNAFYRMVNRRGLPEQVLSDNGTNLKSGERELRELEEQLDKDKIMDSTSHQGIKWDFNPPSAPHFSGVHEIMVKAAKRAIYSILGNADVTDEELHTAITGAEALINSRPITYQSSNIADSEPLTPNHFLIGQLGGKFAPESVDYTHYNPQKRWRRVQELVRHFWNRWLREWVPSLNATRKWKVEHRDLKVDDVVLVMEPNTPRASWPLGRVTDVFPGVDGHVRVVNVQIGSKKYRRPIHVICPLDAVNDKK